MDFRQTHRLALVYFVGAALSAFPQSSAADEPNLLGLPAKAFSKGGTVMLCGGGALPEEVYEEFVRLAGGKQARIILIPSAYPYDGPEHLQRAFGGWSNYAVASFEFLHTDEPDEADSDIFA